MPSHIAVVGSINLDRTLRTVRLPRPGETLVATAVFEGDGGKGANQAVGLARLGFAVVMVGAVGADDEGDRLVANLGDEGVDVSAIVRSDARTGSATIVVDDAGENFIVIDPGANGTLTAPDVDIEAVRTADAVLIQMEIPDEAIAAAVGAETPTVVLNPAPARQIDGAVLASVDYLIPNRSELGLLANVNEPETMDDIAAAVAEVPFDGITVVTLGSNGAAAFRQGELLAHVEPPAVDIVDTVGAGDAFCAAFTASIVGSMSLEDAVGRAVGAGALAATRHGARAGLPTSSDIDSSSV